MNKIDETESISLLHIENQQIMENEQKMKNNVIMKNINKISSSLFNGLQNIKNVTNCINIKNIRNNLSGIRFVTETVAILTSEYVKYKLYRGSNFNATIKNIASKLAGKNMFFIKIFQGLSNSTIFDKELFNFFIKYTDSVDYCENEIDLDGLSNLINIAKKYGHNLTIDSFKPLNSGIIALVYTGQLDNKKVIIKYLRKNIDKHMINSMNDMDFLINILRYAPYLRDLNLYDLFNENKQILLDQLDFNNEVNNIKTFQTKFDTFPNIIIPNVYSYFTEENHNVIVMNYIDGMRIEHIDTEDKDIYSKILCKFNVKAIFFDSLYHSDLHAGNILFIKNKKNNNVNDDNVNDNVNDDNNNVESTDYEKSTDNEKMNNNEKNNDTLSIGIIDYGIIGRLTREEQNTFFLFFKYVREADYKVLAEFIVDNLSEDINDSGIKIVLEPTIKNDVCNKIEKICEKALTDKTKFFGGEEIFAINKVLKLCNMKIARFFCKVEMSMAIGENVCANLSYKTTYTEHLITVFDEFFTIADDF